MRKNLTIKQVAQLAGVSVSVASRALSNEDRPVSQKNKIKVIEAAEQLGYHANPFAQSLSSGQTGLVGVVVNHISDLSDLELFDSLIKKFQEHNKQIIIIRIKSNDQKKDLFKNAFTHNVDAALIFSDLISPVEARSYFKTDKVIMLNGRFDEQSCAIHPDDKDGITAAVHHAKDNKVETAIVVTGRRTNNLELKRIDLLLSCLSDEGIMSRRIDAGDYSYKSGQQCAEKLFADNKYPDAVFCTSDTLAMGVADVLKQKRDLDIGKDLLLFGFDNMVLADDLGYCLSSIGYDRDHYIAKIIELSIMDSNPDEPTCSISIPTKFYHKTTI